MASLTRLIRVAILCSTCRLSNQSVVSTFESDARANLRLKLAVASIGVFLIGGSPIADSVQFVSCGELPAGNLQRPGNRVQYLGQFHMIFGVLSITGAITRREWFHKLMALAFVLLLLLYITLLFARL